MPLLTRGLLTKTAVHELLINLLALPYPLPTSIGLLTRLSKNVRRRFVHRLMAVTSREVIPTKLTKKSLPIQYLTENDFSIVRECEIDRTVSAAGPTHQFLVRDRHGYELQITVHLMRSVIEEVLRRCRGHLTMESSYWINLAERHLADYLWKQDDYPPDAKLNVHQLTPDDIDLAHRWDGDT
jgi:hypothetical protein